MKCRASYLLTIAVTGLLYVIVVVAVPNRPALENKQAKLAVISSSRSVSVIESAKYGKAFFARSYLAVVLVGDTVFSFGRTEENSCGNQDCALFFFLTSVVGDVVNLIESVGGMYEVNLSANFDSWRFSVVGIEDGPINWAIFQVVKLSDIGERWGFFTREPYVGSLVRLKLVLALSNGVSRFRNSVLAGSSLPLNFAVGGIHRTPLLPSDYRVHDQGHQGENRNNKFSPFSTTFPALASFILLIWGAAWWKGLHNYPNGLLGCAFASLSCICGVILWVYAVNRFLDWSVKL